MDEITPMDTLFHRCNFLSLVGFSLILSGCQSTGSSIETDPFPNLHCLIYGVQSSISRAQIEYIREHSESGNLPCKLTLGDLYERGHGVPQEIPKAKALYQSVADVDKSAYYQLGRMEEEGIGGPPNYEKARQFTSVQPPNLGTAAVRLSWLDSWSTAKVVLRTLREHWSFIWTPHSKAGMFPGMASSACVPRV